MKRFLKFLGAVLLCALLLPVPALAETPEETREKDFSDSAKILHGLGLFQGSPDGYETDRAPTRAEAAVMLVRLLGKEDDALASDLSHPFRDVPKWAYPHVAYLYANGLTKGVSETSFGTGLCDANMYAAFLLRALGHEDEAGGFQYAGDMLSRAHEIGLLSDENLERLRDTDTFLRGDLAVLSLWALFTELKDSEACLIDRLVSEDAVPEAAAKKYTDILKASKLKSQGFFLSEEENGYESHLVETVSLSQAGYAPISTDKYISDAKGILTDEGWREAAKVTELSQDSEETYTVYSTDAWYYYDFGDGAKYKKPSQPTDEEPSTLSGLLNQYKSATIEEKGGMTIIREEMSDEIAEKRAKKLFSHVLGTDESYLNPLDGAEGYSLRPRGCEDTYTLDAEGYVLQWTESLEFYFQLRVSLREDPPYLIVSDTAADYNKLDKPADVVFPDDLRDYPEF
jgi:hypothetical protein